MLWKNQKSIREEEKDTEHGFLKNRWCLTKEENQERFYL